jgi:branched-chain amino acid transport system substrate-binding protein
MRRSAQPARRSRRAAELISGLDSRPVRASAVTLCAIFAVGAAVAVAAHYDPGASAGEIRIGNIAPYSGTSADYAVVARAEAAYLRMINDRGGINGRKIEFISVDDAGDPTRTLELARRLVEQDQVLALFSTFGTDANLAIRAYANQQRIPQLFVEASSSVFDDPDHFPWTMGFYATYRTEGLAYARYLLQTRSDARIAVLYEDSTSGAEFYQGIRDGLGDKSAMIVQRATYHASDRNADAQLDNLKSSGADVFMDLAFGSMSSAAIRRAYDIGWHPLQFIPNASLSVAAFLDPAGLDKAAGIISSARSKSWWHGNSERDPEVRAFLDWMNKYNPQASLRDQLNVAGYERAEALVAVLNKCGDELTRANLMAQAASLDTQLGMLRPGIRLKTSAHDYQPIKQLFLIRFDGREWVPLGALASAEQPQEGP